MSKVVQREARPTCHGGIMCSHNVLCAMPAANSAPAQRLASFLSRYVMVSLRVRARSGPGQRGLWHIAPDLVGLWHTAPVPRRRHLADTGLMPEMSASRPGAV
jgi:hypothetical protein